MIRITRSPLALLPLALLLLSLAACQRGDSSDPAGEAEARQPVTAPTGWTWYHNQPMGYTVRLPNNVRIDRSRSTRLERFYTGPDGQVEVTLRFEEADGTAGIDQLMSEHQARRNQGGSVVHSASGAEYFEVESVSGGDVLFEKAYLRDGQLLWLAVRYPEADREAYADAATTIANSFPNGRSETAPEEDLAAEA
jgi:hypothetical protein